MALAVLREQVRQHQGSRAALAAQLGISERSLYRKLKELEAYEQEGSIEPRVQGQAFQAHPHDALGRKSK